MSKLIIYTSKKGCTEKCANFIHNQHPESDLVSISKDTVSLNNYDEVIIGSPIYMGMINKKIKQFLSQNEEILKTKTIKVFLCGMNNTEKEKVFETNFSKDLLTKIELIDYVGGAYDFERLNFLQKFVVKKIANVTSSIENINYELLKKY